MVNLIDFGKKRMDNVMANELKIRVIQKVADIIAAPGKEVVDTKNVMALVYQVITEVRPDEAGTASN
jgi:hypothetical protein